MAVQLVVSSLGGERMCEVAGELAWTGRQLKLAVEEATGAALLVCQQELSIGPNRVEDTSVLGDLVAAGAGSESGAAGEPVQVSCVRREEPRILRDCADRRRLSQSLLAFEGSPTRLVFFSGHHLAVDLACAEEHDEGQLRVLPMRAAEDLAFLPLSIFGIEEADISAVLCLAGAFELIGDGTDALAFAFQLMCGDVVGGLMAIEETMQCASFQPVSVSVSHRAACAADLLEAIPELRGARRDGEPRPLYITAGLARLNYQYPRTHLPQRVRGAPLERATPGREETLEPAILQACQHLDIPDDMMEAMTQAGSIDYDVRRAMFDVITPGGNGGGHPPSGRGSSGLTWEELIDAMRAKLQREQGPAAHPYYEPVLGRIAAQAVPGARPTSEQFSSAVFASLRVAEDLVFGGKKAVNYDEWVRDRAAAAEAATAAAPA